jgi:Na+-transporting NADH:ubiquinone oxidoreductase subunit A
VVIELDQGEGEQEVVEFEAYTGKDIDSLTGEQIAGLLLESGLWTVIRARPFGRTAIPRTSPHSIFITAMDTSPHAPSVDVALQGREDDFLAGVRALSALTEGKTWVCRATGSNVPVPEGGNIQLEEFEGPHPAGTPGVHIHFLDPAGRDKTVWYVNYQDTAAIGHLLTTGKMDVERVISIGGPAVKNPRLLRTRLGASLNELLEDEFSPGNNRVISGSVLYGRAAWDEIHGYLGRYHLQVTALPEGGQRYFLGWLAPGFNMFSVITAYASSLLPGKKFRMTTSTNGSSRAMVPIGTYEKVMPMDIIPTYLLRALAVGDAERAEQLGCLELEEEDLALCTFVCPGKTNYGPMLREVLTEIEKEG